MIGIFAGGQPGGEPNSGGGLGLFFERGGNPGNGETMIGVACIALAKAQPLRKEEEGWQGLVGLTDTQYPSLATRRPWPEAGRLPTTRRTELWPGGSSSHGEA